MRSLRIPSRNERLSHFAFISFLLCPACSSRFGPPRCACIGGVLCVSAPAPQAARSCRQAAGTRTFALTPTRSEAVPERMGVSYVRFCFPNASPRPMPRAPGGGVTAPHVLPRAVGYCCDLPHGLVPMCFQDSVPRAGLPAGAHMPIHPSPVSVYTARPMLFPAWYETAK
jgi:hypothetical protein